MLGQGNEDACLLEENRQNGIVVKERQHFGANKIVRWFQSEVVFKISNNLLVPCGRHSSHRWPLKGNSKGVRVCNDGPQPWGSDGHWAFVRWVPTLLLTEVTSSQLKKWHLLWLGGHIKVDAGALKLWWANWKASGHQVPRQHPWGSPDVGWLDQCGREDLGASGSSYLSIGMGVFLNLTTWFLGLPSKIGGLVGFPISVRRYQLKQWAKKLINRRARGS